MKYSFPVENRLDYILKKIYLGSLLSVKNRLKTDRNIKLNKKKDIRYLEIGPGSERIKSFETLNIIDASNVDYIMDISKGMPLFDDNTFDIIYCSHILEHIPWYNVKNVFKELYRILKPDGSLEIWVPDSYKICKVIVDYEENEIDNTNLDGWYRFNEDKDPIIWGAGRIFTYGDGLGSLCHHNWHRGLFTEKYLKRIFNQMGFKEIAEMDNSQVRGYNHGWINLGVKGIK